MGKYENYKRESGAPHFYTIWSILNKNTQLA